jgi:two-component system, sensor histidine kinase
MIQGVQASGMRLRLPMVGIVTALPLIAFALAMIVIVNGQQQRVIEDMLRQAASASVQNVDERIQAVQSALQILGASMEEAGDAPISAQTHRALRRRPDWMALEVRDRDGSARTYLPDGSVSDASSGPGSDVSQAEAVFRYGEPRVGGIIVDPGNDREPAVPVSIPVFDDRGVAHVLTAHVRAWEINRALRDQGLAPGWILAIMDDNQRLLARNLSDESRDPLLGSPPDPPVIAGLRGGKSFFFSQTLRGARVYTVTATSAATGWTVLLGAPAAEVEQMTKWTVVAVTGGAAAALALALGLGWVLAR